MRELERTVLITGTPGAIDVPARLIATLGPEGVLAAKDQARVLLSGRHTRRVRDVMRTLDDLDEAIARLRGDGAAE